MLTDLNERPLMRPYLWVGGPVFSTAAERVTLVLLKYWKLLQLVALCFSIEKINGREKDRNFSELIYMLTYRSLIEPQKV